MCTRFIKLSLKTSDHHLVCNVCSIISSESRNSPPITPGFDKPKLPSDQSDDDVKSVCLCMEGYLYWHSDILRLLHLNYNSLQRTPVYHQSNTIYPTETSLWSRQVSYHTHPLPPPPSILNVLILSATCDTAPHEFSSYLKLLNYPADPISLHSRSPPR